MDSTPPATRRRSQTRARLVEAAEELFVARGMHGTSIEQVCERAGFTRGAFYSNFASLDELLVAVHDRRAGLAIETVREAVGTMTAGDRAPSPADVIAVVLERLPVDRAWHVLGAELSLAALRDPALADVQRAERAELVDALVPTVTRALEAAGLVAPDGVDELTRDLVAAYVGTADDRLLHHDDTPTVRLMTRVVSASTHPRG
ncbi:TetR/AcrR family transcriptional regulator [Aeromicrobium massiliense]|uniref:TetR/AcrR family transcriptional regulator n=1 Tax=Aeromicrobium massiliense TaxID=1464554 RepID=UPI00155AEA17|nr:TetR/AcrR family transcriptional regulator [Aeromicrobium massiliense]